MMALKWGQPRVWSELGCHLCGGVRRNAGKGRWMMHWEVMVLERGGPE